VQPLAPVRAAIIARQELRTQDDVLADILAREGCEHREYDAACRACRLGAAAQELVRARAYLSQAITHMYPLGTP
jgi:hypothetical protein